MICLQVKNTYNVGSSVTENLFFVSFCILNLENKILSAIIEASVWIHIGF